MQPVTNIQEIEIKKNEKKNRKNIGQLEEIETHLLRAEADIEHGRTKDAREVYREWEQMGRI